MSIIPPINFKNWIEENREYLKPPVGNRIVYQDTDFMIMVVGGPNVRKDYHFNEGEEFYYQIEGDIVVKTIQDGEKIDVPIHEGEIFLLPPKIPHSPQRPANTVGLVIEKQREEGELDGLQWFCEGCGHVLYEEFFQLKSLVEQLPPVFERYYSDEKNMTCNDCGIVMERP